MSILSGIHKKLDQLGDAQYEKAVKEGKIIVPPAEFKKLAIDMYKYAYGPIAKKYNLEFKNSIDDTIEMYNKGLVNSSRPKDNSPIWNIKFGLVPSRAANIIFINARNDLIKHFNFKENKISVNDKMKISRFEKLSSDKKYIYIAAYIDEVNSIDVELSCIPNTEEYKLKYKLVKEDACFMHSDNPYYKFLESGGQSPVICPFDTDFSDVARSRDLNPEDDYEKFFQYPQYNKAIQEHMDLYDEKTRLALTNLSEADQSSVLTNLTSKLYDNIVKKANEIDYGEIPETKGDITKLSNFVKLQECVDLLKDIVKEYRQDSAPIDEIQTCIDNIIARKTTFNRGYMYDIEFIQVMYCNMVLSVVSSISYMIATCIEFIKSPKDETFATVLDTMAYKKTKDHIIFTNIKKLNASCAKGDFDKAMDHFIAERTKHFTGAIGVGTAVAAVAIILSIIPILREAVFFFYYARTRISDFFDIQADLLQMNAATVSYSDREDKTEIATKQMAVSQMFRTAANKIAVNCKQAESKSSKEISSSDKKMKIDDISTEDQVSSLF